jgi:hypothetical protein
MYGIRMLRFSMFRAALVGTLFLAGLAGLTGPARAVTPVSPVAAFVDGINDLPLMPGLSPVTEEGLVFDKPGGRIVHAVARGTVTPAAVRQFYADTAPQLGWRGAGDNRFVREGEVLQIELVGAPGRNGAGPLTVRFVLVPR